MDIRSQLDRRWGELSADACSAFISPHILLYEQSGCIVSSSITNTRLFKGRYNEGSLDDDRRRPEMGLDFEG